MLRYIILLHFYCKVLKNSNCANWIFFIYCFTRYEQPFHLFRSCCHSCRNELITAVVLWRCLGLYEEEKSTAGITNHQFFIVWFCCWVFSLCVILCLFCNDLCFFILYSFPLNIYILLICISFMHGCWCVCIAHRSQTQIVLSPSLCFHLFFVISKFSMHEMK